jgi:alpha-mannosidase
VCEPEEHVPALVEQFNRLPNAPFDLRIAVPGDFENAVSKRTDRPVLEGDLNPIFQGSYSSRIELKQHQRNLERLLTTAEKLAVLGQWLGSPVHGAALWRAWEPMLFNQTHDLASGVMTDRVYDDTLASYQFSKRLADELVETGLERASAKIDTQGEGTALVVWNPLGWTRTDVAEADLGIADADIRGLTLLDSAGQTVPHQIVAAERYAGGGLLRAKIAFIARDVPAMGYAVYHAQTRRTSAEPPAAAGPGKEPGVIENEHYRAVFDMATGAMSGLTVKAGNWQALAGPANVVSREHDGGDLWELYQPLDGGSRIAMTRKQPVPQTGKAVFSRDFKATPGSVVAGPVFSEFNVAHPLDNGTFATSVRLYAGLRRIDIRTQIVNNKKFVRYQALFPTSIRNGRNVQEIPFGAIERPAAIEFPAQNWADYGDGQRGVALLNRGLPGNLTTDGTMMLSLARATAIVAYGFGGGYGPGMSSESGFELGKPLAFDYAVVPHAGDWREAGIYRSGLEFNNPLIVRKTPSHAGSMPKRWGLLEVSHPNVVVSALKPGRGGAAILRIYEAAGTRSPGIKIGLHAKVASADEVNLMEDPARKVAVANDMVAVDLGPFEIKTLKFQLEPAK